MFDEDFPLTPIERIRSYEFDDNNIYCCPYNHHCLDYIWIVEMRKHHEENIYIKVEALSPSEAVDKAIAKYLKRKENEST